jgi:solute carrier family 8 (sodium/calcium exchanger)
VPGKDYEPVSGVITFEAGETEKEIFIKLLPNSDSTEKDDIFQVQLHSPSGGAKLSKKKVILVEICGDSIEFQKAKGLEEIIKEMQMNKQISWLGQFKQAVILSPQIDENGEIDNITYLEAFLHFFSIGWKVIFAIVPPARYLGGWLCFIVALAMIGAVTAIVGEIAALFGCVIGLKESVTAISFVALGTSLPDTCASKTAAEQSKYADAAIGNVTGSNSVNVFLGLGLPWLIGSIYYAAKGEDFLVPAAGLSFSVILFLITSSLCLITLVLRRIILKGELGGNMIVRWVTFVWFVGLWLVYLIMSSLKAYDLLW